MKGILAGKTRASVKDGQATRTRNRARRCWHGGPDDQSLGGILTYAVELGIIDQNPVHGGTPSSAISAAISNGGAWRAPLPALSDADAQRLGRC